MQRDASLVEYRNLPNDMWHPNHKAQDSSVRHWYIPS